MSKMFSLCFIFIVKKDGPKEKDTLEIWETETGNCVKGFCIKKRENRYNIIDVILLVLYLCSFNLHIDNYMTVFFFKFI